MSVRSPALELPLRDRSPVPLSDSASAFTLRPEGPCSLRESALFGFGQRHHRVFDGTMRLAFCVDGLRAQAGVALTQADDGTVHGVVSGVLGDTEPGAIARQVSRVLSLDHDANGFVALGARDPVLRKLLAAAPGLRPPLFYSPYEAALWAVLSARKAFAVAERLRERLARAAGARFEVAGQTLFAAPLPSQLLALGIDGLLEIAGLDARRAERMLAIAEAMRAERFGADALRGLEPAVARARLRELPGIGPFYADLILVRATGASDVLPSREPRFLALVAALYGAGDGEAIVARMAKTWSPWRTWVAVLVRAAGPRILPEAERERIERTLASSTARSPRKSRSTADLRLRTESAIRVPHKHV